MISQSPKKRRTRRCHCERHTVIIALSAVGLAACLLQLPISDAFLLPCSSNHVRGDALLSSTIIMYSSKAKFSQPAFSQPPPSPKQPQLSDEQQLQSPTSSTSTKPARAFPKSDSRIGDLHYKRVKMAGRVGTKRFVDPCKVFVGNLPFTATVSELEQWFCTKMGLPPAVLYRSNGIKVVTDWKTGKSKGYAFVDFTEPIYATVCMEKCHNQDFFGRLVSVQQGKKKEDDLNQLYLEKKARKAANREEAAIQQGLRAAAGEEEEDTIPTMDAKQAAMIRRLDADLIDSSYVAYNVDDDLAAEFGGADDDDDDDDDGVDGYWYGTQEEEAEIVEFDQDGYTKPMNREQRRDSARKIKRRKLPHKGFGPAN